MKIKKVQSACLILACIAATGLIGCGKTDETSKKHEAITFMAPYLEVDSFIEEVHKTYPEIELEVVPYSGANTTTYLQNMLEADDLPDICTQTFYKPDVVDVSDKMIDLSGYRALVPSTVDSTFMTFNASSSFSVLFSNFLFNP